MFNRNFSLLLLITIAIFFAMELLTFTVLLSVFEETESTLKSVGALIARALPTFLLGPIAGVLSDRLPRKNVLVCMNFLRVVLMGAVCWLLQANEELPVLAIYLVLMALSTAEVFHNPARIALIPGTVPQDKLVSANSLMMIAMQTMLGVSALSGALLLNIFTLQQISFGVMGLFAIATILPIPIRATYHHETAADAPKESVWKSMKSGWSYLNQHPIAKPLTVMEAIEHIPHGIWSGALMLAFTTKVLGGTAEEWGYTITSFFFGMVLGAVSTMFLKKSLTNSPGKVIAINALISGILTFAYALSSTAMIGVGLALLFGPPFAIRDVAQDTLLQTTVDEGQLGRVYATREMIRSTVFMVSAVFFAWLSAYVDLRTIYLIGGVVYLITAIYAFSNQSLRNSRMPDHAMQQ